MQSARGECDLLTSRYVDAVDLSRVLAAWDSDGSNDPATDFDEDGIVGPLDLAFVLAKWGLCP